MKKHTYEVGGLRFISLRRKYRETDDTSSLSIGGRQGEPGLLTVVGGLEHCMSIAPKKEADRRALIAFLESDECKAAVWQDEHGVARPPLPEEPPENPWAELAETIPEAQEEAIGAKLAEVLRLQTDPQNKNYWLTTWGRKTNLGLARSVFGLIIEATDRPPPPKVELRENPPPPMTAAQKKADRELTELVLREGEELEAKMEEAREELRGDVDLRPKLPKAEPKTLKEMSTGAWKETRRDGLCCPVRGYKGYSVWAIVRAGQSMRFIFADGATLTIGPGRQPVTTLGTGMQRRTLMAQAKFELRERHPRTRNLYVEINEREERK